MSNLIDLPTVDMLKQALDRAIRQRNDSIREGFTSDQLSANPEWIFMKLEDALVNITYLAAHIEAPQAIKTYAEGKSWRDIRP